MAPKVGHFIFYIPSAHNQDECNDTYQAKIDQGFLATKRAKKYTTLLAQSGKSKYTRSSLVESYL